MKNKQVKQMIMNITIKGRKLFWFGEESEKFIATSLQEVIDLHRDWLGDEEVEDILTYGSFGELKLNTDPKYWFKPLCYDVDEGKTLPTITAIMAKGCYQVSTGYNY